jgi:uncharacterized protein involved in exopolysaccharide biosynthesis
MKTLQETILELARSQSVISATLTTVGKPPRHRGIWPSHKDIDDFREQIQLTPPGGAEFGKTEVFYLSVLDTNRARAKELVAALCDELELRMQQLRDQRASSMIAELERGVSIARDDLDCELASLKAMESEVGADLSELRSLVSDIGGTSEAAQQLRDIATEVRENDTQRRASRRLITLVRAAQEDPSQVTVMPNRLLESQPTLQQLKQALVDAQVHTASVLGLVTSDHPLAKAALDAERRVHNELRRELAVSIRGLEFDVQFRNERDQELQARADAIRKRLAGLAAARAPYANLVASVSDHTRLLEDARRNLAEARAKQAGAQSASVIGRIDGVEAGTRPVGLGRTTTVAAGGVGGLLLGLGLVFLMVGPGTIGAVPAIDATTTTVPNKARSNGGRPAGALAATLTAPFGMFRDVSLAEAIRRVERRRTGQQQV